MKGREEGSREQEDGGWLERSSEEARAEERTEAYALNTVRRSYIRAINKSRNKRVV